MYCTAIKTAFWGLATGVSLLAIQERLYLRRLMLDLQGSARSSLDFYRLGKVVGEGSFAQVSVKAPASSVFALH